MPDTITDDEMREMGSAVKHALVRPSTNLIVAWSRFYDTAVRMSDALAAANVEIGRLRAVVEAALVLYRAQYQSISPAPWNELSSAIAALDAYRAARAPYCPGEAIHFEIEEAAHSHRAARADGK
jgi:hypothetical protein